jgi:hypothetical protein
MSGVFQNIYPPTPSPPGECVPPLVREEDTLAGWRGGGGSNSSEDARHCSVLYICKYFVEEALSILYYNPHSTGLINTNKTERIRSSKYLVTSASIT